MKIRKPLYTILLLAALSLCSAASAQVTADPSDPTTIGFSAKKNKMKWHLAGSTSAVRGLDYYNKISLQHSVSAIYDLSKKETISGNLTYTHPGDGLVTFKEDWGFEDLSFSYTRRKSISIHRRADTSLRVRASLPTSETSRLSSFQGSISVALPTSFKWMTNRVVVSPMLGFSMHKFNTANKAGTQQNTPASAALSFVLSRSFNKYISGALTASYTGFMDYESRYIDVQSLGASLTVPIERGVSLTGGYNWRDRRITNNSLFDDDRSRYFLSLSLVL